MGNLFAGPHLWIILIIILLLFGAAKLPALAKSMGQSARVFRGEMKAMKAEDAADKADAAPADTASGTTTSTEAPSTDTPPRSS
ncbi:Sec-independent protein translocase protein TatA [Microbacterium hydrocarbonoxydans]|jgi:sec-independent protein translocase protein TatA|uniref:Sec-independent protein translocase protein TatA n=1 Tax=Microbacterium hydrocarbonoxydans TaxID=273678 RepID=A0A0M2HN89_9MICO|nr:twin-arginine translocase TatA/TatE family subunit [Microbacterium hydrocarbonoxydans]KJL46403.1 Sec-independent protein translocase protein TatA [Microbacterium hydrocarbonoxydans]